ncbi:MAG TPA: cellulose synthase operon protein YhjQ/BcsQ [Terriglobales bacterium]|nr:cellulose synthase operon protein YhjQ/BcsQ [Terriglobales bacterium]
MSRAAHPAERAPVPPALRGALAAWNDWAGIRAERVRLAAVRLVDWREQTGRSSPILTCTSGSGGEGKSVAAANLARALARIDSGRVLLVDADARGEMSLSRHWHVEGRPGWSDWMAEAISDPEACISSIGPDVALMAPGRRAETPIQLLLAPGARERLERLRAQFRWVVVDAPPLLPLADASAWGSLSDGVLLIVRDGWERRPLVARAMRGLVRARVAGILMTYSRAAERECRPWMPPLVRITARRAGRRRTGG